jgi:hypothetical protein
MSDRKPSAPGRPAGGYLGSTRHPWPCLLFVLPLLVLYETGVWALGGHITLRNGADAWLRWGLAECGLRYSFVAPLVVAALLTGWAAWRWGDRPERIGTPLLGMLLESFLFALALWGIGRLIGPLFGQVLTAAGPKETFGQALAYLGAGVYEEVGFRLVLFTGLAALLRAAEAPAALVLPVAALVSALAFAAAHHVGPHGEAICPDVFVFRTLAGLYFALLFQLRGCGVAVGAHAAYDMLVGLSVG